MDIPETLTLAVRHHQAGNMHQAEQLYRQILDADPRHYLALHQLGILACQVGRSDLGLAHFIEVLRLKPDFAQGYNSLGIALRDQGRLEEAIVNWQTSLRLQPIQAEAHNNLGLALKELGRLEESAANLEQALVHYPNFVEAHNNLGNTLKEQGKLQESAACYLRTLRLKPDHADAHKNLGILNLLLGNFSQGWTEFEWRWRCHDFSLPKLPQPLWDGSPLHGRTILLHTEQGLGDTIQFIRYAQLIKRTGGSTILMCPATLVRLLTRCDGLDLVLPGEPLPRFDVHAPLLNLPRLLGTNSLEAIPNDVPYIHADPDLVERWRKRVASDEWRVASDEELLHSPLATRHSPLLAGISWQGNPSNTRDRWRSVSLARFSPLAAIAGVKLVSLQVGPGSEQLRQTPNLAVDMGSELTDLADTAAVVKNLDLIITVDTALAHLAGAARRAGLGRPAVRSGLALAPGPRRQSVVPVDAALSPTSAPRLGRRFLRGLHRHWKSELLQGINGGVMGRRTIAGVNPLAAACEGIPASKVTTSVLPVLANSSARAK